LEGTESAGKYWLTQLEEPWLLIIDNADNPELDLSHLFPRGDRGLIIVTTRNPDFRRYATAGSVELKGLKEMEALHLLLRRADVPRPWDAATEMVGNEIAKALGYLALALIQAGTSIYRKICGLKDYLNFHKRYQNRYRTMPRLDKSFKTDDDPVYSAFDVSLKFLESKPSIASQDAVEILNIIAFYHFEHIRVDIFTRAVDNRVKTESPSPNKSLASRIFQPLAERMRPPRVLPKFLKQDRKLLCPYRVRRALYELYSLSLISYDGRDASFSLHPLVHAWARDRLDPGEKALWAQIALNTLTESIVLPPNGLGEDQGELRRDLLPHLDASLAACPIQFSDYSSCLGRLQLASAFIFQQTLLVIIRDQALNAGKCGYVYAERGRFKEATTYLSMVMDILVRILGCRNERTMEAMLGLAATYWGLGRLEEAIDLQKNVVEARAKVLGPDHCKTLQAMDQLGRSYWLHGQYKEALSLQQVTTERMKATLGPEDDRTLAAMDNLGVTLGSWHRFQESMHIHRHVLCVREKSRGLSDLETLTTMNNLAMALLDLERLDEAQEMMAHVYEERKLKLGKEHPWTLWALCNLAKIRTELGSLQDAYDMLVGGIAAGKRSLSEDHLGVLMGCGNLARVYFFQGRLEEAETLCRDTIQRLEKSRGTEHPDCIYALWRLARLHERQGKVEEGVEKCKTALRRAHARLTDEHPLFTKIESDLTRLRSLLPDKADVSDTEDGTFGTQIEPAKRRRLLNPLTW
jgi:tetratricopeptide (TPR) repeat protein